jgi:hypothetical protein
MKRKVYFGAAITMGGKHAMIDPKLTETSNFVVMDQAGTRTRIDVSALFLFLSPSLSTKECHKDSGN